MTAAERLRQEMEQGAPFTKDEFIQAISKRIKCSGRARYYCDRHIRTTEVTGNGDTIHLKHEQIAKDYALSEGFNVHDEYNGYGVRSIVFTL